VLFKPTYVVIASGWKEYATRVIFLSRDEIASVAESMLLRNDNKQKQQVIGNIRDILYNYFIANAIRTIISPGTHK
jgi:hypothetical protein